MEIIASGLQFPEGPVAAPDGSVIVVEIARETLSRIALDGRVQVIANIPEMAALSAFESDSLAVPWR